MALFTINTVIYRLKKLTNIILNFMRLNIYYTIAIGRYKTVPL